MPPPTPPPSPTPEPTPSPTEPAPQPVREVVIALPEPLDDLNPLYARSWSAWAVKDLFLAGLWHLDGGLSPHPELATQVPTRANGGISDDGRTLTIHLRPEAAWSDGQPLTVDDLIFTYQMAVAEGNGVTSRFPYTAVESITSPDAHTLQVRFRQPFAPWPSTLFPYVLPRHILEPVFAREGSLDRAVWNRLPTVGSGPFVLVGADDGEWVFEANQHYWRGRPAVQRVRVFTSPQPEERLAAVAAGLADLAPVLWSEPAAPVEPPSGVRSIAAPSGLVETLFLNLDPRTGHPALQQEEVRQAIARALDRQRLCGLLWQAEPASSLWAGTLFEDPTLGTAPSGDSARLLEEAGWRDGDGDGIREREGVRLVLRYAVPAGRVDRTGVQAAVEEMLEAVGIGVEPAGVEGGWDLAEWAQQPAGYPDPDDPRWLCVEARPGGTNPAGVCDEELDRLLYAQATTADLDERAALFYQIEALNRERVWWVPLCRVMDLWAVGDATGGLRPWRGGPFWNAWEW